MELLVVVAILGMISGMAVPSFLTLQSRVQARSVTQEIASELRLARQLAISSRERVRVLFDSEQQTVAAQFANGTMARHVYRYGDKGIAIAEPSAGPEVIFYPSGRSATATTIHLRNREGQVQTLTVSITGRVSIQ